MAGRGKPMSRRAAGGQSHRSGTAVWASPAWRDEAVSWLDERLAAVGVERSGDVEQPHLRPWATVLRAPTTAGVVWLKAAGRGTAFEVGLYELLAKVVPDRVLIPLATDLARSWIVLPDGGPALGERLTGGELAEALVAALEPVSTYPAAEGLPELRAAVADWAPTSPGPFTAPATRWRSPRARACP